MDLRMKWIHVDVSKGFPNLHQPDYIEKWKTYLNRVEAGEIERDFIYEASLEGHHYWTVDEVAGEAEKMAEQLAMVALLGVEKRKRKT